MPRFRFSTHIHCHIQNPTDLCSHWKKHQFNTAGSPWLRTHNWVQNAFSPSRNWWNNLKFGKYILVLLVLLVYPEFTLFPISDQLLNPRSPAVRPSLGSPTPRPNPWEVTSIVADVVEIDTAETQLFRLSHTPQGLFCSQSFSLHLWPWFLIVSWFHDQTEWPQLLGHNDQSWSIRPSTFEGSEHVTFSHHSHLGRHLSRGRSTHPTVLTVLMWPRHLSGPAPWNSNLGAKTVAPAWYLPTFWPWISCWQRICKNGGALYLGYV